jgi:hypothetical protein
MKKSKANFSMKRPTGQRNIQEAFQPYEHTNMSAISSPIHANNYSYLYYKDKNHERSPAFIKYWNDLSSKKVKNEWSKYTSNYKSPYGYMPWDWVMSQITAEAKNNHDALANQEFYDVNKTNDSLSLNILSESYIFNTGFLASHPSPIFLTKDLIDAFMHTDINGFDASPNEVYPFFTLMLPKNALNLTYVKDAEYSKDRNNISIKENYYTLLVMTNKMWIKSIENVIKTSKLGKLEHLKNSKIFEGLTDLINPNNYLPGEYGLNKFKPGFKVFAFNDKAGYIKLDFLWEQGTKKWKMENLLQNGKGTEIHHQIGNSILNIVANSILLMSYQPEYVTVQSPQVTRGFGNSNKDEPKQATWLGEHYKQAKVRYEYPEDHIPQKGKSPRSHWRRGHMRTVLQGPGRKQRVFKWIKPVFVVGRGTDG